MRAGAPARAARAPEGQTGRCSGIISGHRPARPGGTIQLLDDQHWHALPDAEVIDLLEADGAEGLDRFTVEHRRAQFGLNALTPPKGPGALRRFLTQFADPLVLILLVSAIVTLFLKEWVDAGVIFGVVLLNAVIGYIQEAKADDAIEALSRAHDAPRPPCVRGGEQLRCRPPRLVPGDVVLLQAGDKVPADLRLLARARPAGRRVGADRRIGAGREGRASPSPATRSLADRANMAYAGTLVTTGPGAGVVVATGDAHRDRPHRRLIAAGATTSRRR